MFEIGWAFGLINNFFTGCWTCLVLNLFVWLLAACFCPTWWMQLCFELEDALLLHALWTEVRPGKACARPGNMAEEPGWRKPEKMEQVFTGFCNCCLCCGDLLFRLVVQRIWNHQSVFYLWGPLWATNPTWDAKTKRRQQRLRRSLRWQKLSRRGEHFSKPTLDMWEVV